MVNRHRLLAHEALRWVNFTELGGENRGQLVEAFQKAVDGKAVGEPWCMAFVMYCIKQVDDLIRFMDWVKPAEKGHTLYESEHCWTVWCRSPEHSRSFSPYLGAVAIWKNINNGSGHAGIVTKVSSISEFQTVEGNTSPSSKGDQREGDGVFLKERQGNISNELRLLGFLDPWHE